MIVIVEFGSAVPLIFLSWLVTPLTVGGAGAVASVTVVDPAWETLPALSFDVALIVSLPCNPSFSGIVTLKFPSWSALVSTTLPLGNVTLTVEFASAVPLTSVLTLVTWLICGASGAVASMTWVLPFWETLPALSFDVATIVSPPCNPSFAGISTVKFPSWSVTASTTSPLGNVTLTVEFASACPFNCLLLLLTSFNVGASGAVMSVTIRVATGDSLPALSVAIALNTSPPWRVTPLGISTVYLPWLSAVIETLPPPGKATVTVELGSAVPVTCVALLVIGFITGASGAVASVTVIWSETSLVFPPLLAVAVKIVPAFNGWFNVKEAAEPSLGIWTFPISTLLLSLTVTVAPAAPLTLITVSLSSTGLIDGVGTLEISITSNVFTSSFS